MSTMEQQPDRSATGELMRSELLHPREIEGVSLPGDLQFNTTVKRLEFKHTEDIDEWGNRLSRYRATMSDGVKLGINICEPKERVTDIPVIETPAWFTNLHGFNEHTQRAFGAIGIPSILIGHVGEERDTYTQELGRFLFKPWQAVRDIRSISLGRQAHNMLEILQYPNLGMDYDTDHVFVHGNSRGAMVQFAFLPMAQQRGIDVTFAMPVAPCFAVGFGKEIVREMRQTPNKEILNAGRLAVRNLFNMAETGPSTLNMSPKSLLYEIAHTEALFNGDAGKYAPLTDVDQNMLILAYDDDIAGQKEEWEAIYARHPNVHVRSVPGAHLSIADKRTKAYVMRTFYSLGEQLRENTKPEDLDFTHIKRKLTAVDG